MTPSNTDTVRELNRAKVLFQMRGLCAALGIPGDIQMRCARCNQTLCGCPDQHWAIHPSSERDGV